MSPINRAIYRLLEFTRRRSLAVIIVFAVVTALFAVSLIRIRLDPDITSFVSDDEEITRLMREHGGAAENYLVVAVESADPFGLEGLRTFAAVIAELEELKEIGRGITPFNLVGFLKDGSRLSVQPLSPGAPGTPEELAVFKSRLLASPFAVNLVASEDATTLVAFFPAETSDNYTALMNRIDGILAHLDPYYRVHTTGTIPVMRTTEEYLSRDLSRLLVLAIAVILITFYLGFRSIRAALLPLLVVLMGTVWCLGFMSLAGFALSTISVIIPPLVLALGSSYSIHILNEYYREAAKAGSGNRWITDAIAHVNKTILLASATTIAGLLSLLAVSMRQSREFAVATAVGVAACAILSLFFFPAVLYRLKAPRPKQTNRVLEGLLTRSMGRLAAAVLKGRYAILAVVLAIVAFFGYSVRRLEYNTDAMSYFPEKAEIIQDMLFFTEKIGGFEEIAVTLTAPDRQADYFLNAAVLQKVARFEDGLGDLADVCYVSSFVGYLRHLNETMFGDYAVPQSRAPILLLSRYVKLVSSGDDPGGAIGLLANEDFSAITIRMRIYDSRRGAFIDEVGLKELLGELDALLHAELPGEITVERWGPILRYLSLSNVLQRDSIRSMLIAAAAILLITTAAFRSVKYGLCALIPLSTGVMFNLSFMVVAGIPLDMITIMVSSVAIGVGVDDSIHFLIQFRRQLAAGTEDAAGVIGNTMKITGRPIVLTTVSIVAGLAILSFAVFRPIVYFGLLVVLTLAATCLGTIIALPAVLALGRKRVSEAGG